MNVGEWTTRWAQLRPDEPCLVYQSLELTKKEFNLRINRLAHAFQELGIKKGQRVSALMANSNVFLEIVFALSKLGAIMLPLNFRLAPLELKYIINNADPIALIYSPEFLSVVEELKGEIPTVKHYICEMTGGAEEDKEYESWISDKSEQEPIPDSIVTLDDPQFIMYTSGTTGKPKGAVITQGNTQWNVINISHMYPFEQKDITFCCAPLFHIGALNVSATPSIYCGVKIVIQRLFDAEESLKLIEKNKASNMMGIPVMFQFMSQVPYFDQVDFSSVKYFVASGSSCPKSLIETYQQKGVTFAQGYGMTESASGITALLPDESLKKLGSCGKPFFHLTLKIVDDKSKEVIPGEIGEVLVKGPNVFKEYWRMPKESAEAIVDGWLYTGDIGYFDKDGYLYIKDRLKDMFISGGENVYPAEVEDVIMGLPEILDVGVIGITDETWGESGVAFIVKVPGVEVNEKKILDNCKEKLAKYKIPKKVQFIDTLPRTLTGKILKKDLKARYTHFLEK